MSAPPAIQDLAPADLAWVHALNQANGAELSFMEAPAFAAMTARARFARVAAGESGFLLAYDQPPIPGDSPNFDWITAHTPAALYIDRIAIAPHARRQGLARRFYEDLFRLAADAGFKAIGAEVNADPPNPASDAFHAALGFRPVGEQTLSGRGKRVGYWMVAL